MVFSEKRGLKRGVGSKFWVRRSVALLLEVTEVILQACMQRHSLGGNGDRRDLFSSF